MEKKEGNGEKRMEYLTILPMPKSETWTELKKVKDIMSGGAYDRELVENHGYTQGHLLGMVGHSGTKIHRLSCVYKETEMEQYGAIVKGMIVAVAASYCGSQKWNGCYSGLRVIGNNDESLITCKKCSR